MPVRFFARRLLIGVGLLFAVAVVIFLLIQTVPGDPAMLLLSGSSGTVDPAALAALQAQLGLDQPVWRQFLNYILGLLQGDLGTSFVQRKPVLELLMQRLPNTLELVGFATLVSIVLGVLFGVLSAALFKGSGTVFSAVTSFGLSAPVFVVGTLLVYFVSVKLRWLSAGGYVGWEEPGKHLQLLILPTITIALGLTATIARATRSSVLETKSQDFVRTSRALGHFPGQVWSQAILRNSLTPIVTVIGLQVGILVGSTVLVERVFNWPGLSTLLVESVVQRDYPVIQGVILLTAGIFILINIIVDFLYTVLDPRARSDV